MYPSSGGGWKDFRRGGSETREERRYSSVGGGDSGGPCTWGVSEYSFSPVFSTESRHPPPPHPRQRGFPRSFPSGLWVKGGDRNRRSGTLIAPRQTRGVTSQVFGTRVRQGLGVRLSFSGPRVKSPSTTGVSPFYRQHSHSHVTGPIPSTVPRVSLNPSIPSTVSG